MPSSPSNPPSNHSPPPMTSTPPPNVLQPSPQAPLPPTEPSYTTTTTTTRTLRIGTRSSALAIAQVNIFTDILKTLHPTLPTETVPISVAGDRDKTTNLHTLAQGGKSLWTEEMEVLLLKGGIDCIVHSLKDVPTKVVEGCEVKIVGERGERRDCVVFPRRNTEGMEDGIMEVIDGEGTVGREAVVDSTEQQSPPSKKRKISFPSTAVTASRTLASLPPNAVVGTSSVRRSAMVLRRYPHLRIQNLRGNMGTKLRKVDDPSHGFDCIVTAGAGLQRIGLGDRIDEWLSPDVDGEEKVGGAEGGEEVVKASQMLHAVGQGALGLEIREGDEWIHCLLEGKNGHAGAVVNRVSWECQAERSLLRTLEGGCSVPVGVSCSWEEASSRTQAEDTAPSTSENSANIVSPQPTHPSSTVMAPGMLHMLASVTSVDGTECVAASRGQWVSSDKEADEAGWELARVLVERGAARILETITLNRGMVERGDGA
ncbi:MAG: hypothetical protein Q9170_003183 [Blastenia crenularia]